jgi:UDP-N-acetylglucosamine--N-acetylmuramyl-(pentapeptide) pyrophosphoryl-undecaprenol N-acetylglucosamine transferase
MTKVNGPTILISAGASGGHIFPALAVAEELRSQGANCIFVGNGTAFEKAITDAGFDLEILPASPWNVRNPIRKLWAVVNFVIAFITAMKVIHRARPSVVFGTGGYATVASVLAGRISGVPTIIHEQNVLPGRANKLLAGSVDKIALAFDLTPGALPPRLEKNIKVFGNPVRQDVMKSQNKKRKTSDKFNLLVVGGSQGARILSDVVPAAVALLPTKYRSKLQVIQQARSEDVDRVKAIYEGLKVSYDITSFFDDLAKRMVQSNLMIARAGAGTVSECALLGCATIFVPLKLADGHQKFNAKILTDKDAGILIEEDDFTPENLSQQIQELMDKPDILANMEKRALKEAKPNATKDVAEAVLKLSKMDVMQLAEPQGKELSA